MNSEPKIFSIIIITALIVGGAVYYFTNNKQDTPLFDKQISLANQKLCQEAALKLHELDGKNLDSDTSQMEARYKYIPEESLCVYKGGFVSPDTIHQYIKDTMTNETLSEYISRPGGVVIAGSTEDFEKMEAKYSLGVSY